MKLFIILIALALTTACAKQVPPPVQERPMIPIVLVNIEKNVIVAVPDQPSTKKLLSIRKSDSADDALKDVLKYTQDLKAYSIEVVGIAQECKAELDDRDERLYKIKQYIILNQPSIQPVH